MILFQGLHCVKPSLQSLPENQQIMSTIYSFCIPRMDTRSLPEESDEDTIKTFVASKFTNILDINEDNIDIVIKYTDQGYLYYTAFLHPISTNACYHDIVADIERLEKVKIHFSDKWFWTMRMSTATRPRDFENLYEDIEEGFAWFMDQMAHDEMVLFRPEEPDKEPTKEPTMEPTMEDVPRTKSFDWSSEDDE